MDAKELVNDVREGRIAPEKLVELVVKLGGELEAARRRIADLEKELGRRPTERVEEPYSVDAEEKRQQAKDRRKKLAKKKKNPLRRGRLSTADKLALAVRVEQVFPEGVAPEQCKLSHKRPIWRIENGAAVIVAYEVYRGANGQYGRIPRSLGRSEYGLEIVVTIAFLVHVVGLSFDKACQVLRFFQNLNLKKSQVDALLSRLAKSWEEQFDALCSLLAHSAIVQCDETSWSINSVWAFLSENARIFLYGVHKDADTLELLLDKLTFEGMLVSDDASVYRDFSFAQKCWAHLLRKAIKLTLLAPDNAEYRNLADTLLEIYRKACRLQRDQRYSQAGRAAKVDLLNDEIVDLCSPVWAAELPPLEGIENDYRLLCNEMMRLLLADELFTFVTWEDARSPNGETLRAPGTNNESERSLRNPAQCRDTGRTSKSNRGARRQTVLTTTFESLRLYLSEFTLTAVIQEVSQWWDVKAACFQKLLKSLKISSDDQASGILNHLYPAPDSS
jgi:hypothetical protein